jgi:catechol 2,3-dioxygenase-like lactoylglutathione lyase family enzyme
MNLTLSHCFVTVHDPDLALAFYRDVLGLELRNDVAAEGFRWLTLSPPTQPDVQIVLVEPHAGHSQEDGDAILALLTKGALGGVNFATDDLDGTFEKVRASGAEVMQEPMAQFWGVRDCAFRDPSGSMVRISEARKA